MAGTCLAPTANVQNVEQISGCSHLPRKSTRHRAKASKSFPHCIREWLSSRLGSPLACQAEAAQMKLNGYVPARGGSPGGTRDINHVSAPKGNTPACLCLSTVATALQNEKPQYLRLYEVVLSFASNPVAPGTQERTWTFSSTLPLGNIVTDLASKSLEFLAWEEWNGPGALASLVYFPPNGVLF